METRAKKAIATVGLCSALPIVWTVPGISTYPLSVIGALCVGVLGISMIGTDEEPVDTTTTTTTTTDKDRARAVSCPGV